ncbi:hypothetical protein [Enterobacter hormaechei]|uniref:hypothetical protein n=1 Tax=Enterobacter hormaechei TaxID=158836 RepID=UPI002A755B98|nr:hypothetical protein [Enterobacter hormaechei]MDY3570235.1 hypothetical protein [Enterobacter hormaechei]
MCSVNGSVRAYSQIDVEDAQFIFDIYGDEIICDGDNMTASQFVHLEVSGEADKACDTFFTV